MAFRQRLTAYHKEVGRILGQLERVASVTIDASKGPDDVWRELRGKVYADLEGGDGQM